MASFIGDRTGALARLLLAVGLLVAVVPGCGPGHPKTYPVRGKVVFEDGAPLEGGFIGFESTPIDGTRINARGRVAEDGTFVLFTFAEGDGAVAGKHRVLVRADRKGSDITQDEGVLVPPPPVIHPRFERYETSGLEFTVTEGRNDFTVVVQRPTQGRGPR